MDRSEYSPHPYSHAAFDIPLEVFHKIDDFLGVAVAFLVDVSQRLAVEVLVSLPLSQR